MDKRKLSKLPVVEADDRMIKAARRISKYDKVARITRKARCLEITVFFVEDLKAKNRKPVARTFFSKNDYITQDLTTEKVHWLTGTMAGIELFDRKSKWYRYVFEAYIMSDEEYEILENWFGECENIWYQIFRFQESVLDRKLNERHEKDLSKFRKKMAGIKSAPKSFEKWVWEKGMEYCQYLFYKPTKKNEAECHCYSCGQTFKVDRRKIELRTDKRALCPVCGRTVTCKANGRMKYREWDDRYFILPQMHKGQMLWRYFHAVRITHRDGKVEEWLNELCRGFFDVSKPKYSVEWYEFIPYKNRGDDVWCPSMDRIMCGMAVMYTKGLKELLKDTPLKYSGLYEYAQNSVGPMSYHRYIAFYYEHNKIEWMAKMGMTNLAYEMTEMYGTSDIDWKAKDIFKMLKLSKENTRLMQKLNGSNSELRVLKKAQDKKMVMTEEMLREYVCAFGGDAKPFDLVRRGVSLHKVIGYCNKNACKKRSRYQYTRAGNDIVYDWIDYLKWCKELKYDLDDMSVYMPKDFYRAHDRVMKEYEAHKDKIERRRQKAIEKKALKILALTEERVKEIAGAELSRKFMIVVPSSAEDLRNEGNKLHHCVSTYIEKVARGETSIFFVRKKSAPDEPFYTLEIKKGKFVQCRGSHNKSMTPDVERFVRKFENALAAG